MLSVSDLSSAAPGALGRDALRANTRPRCNTSIGIPAAAPTSCAAAAAAAACDVGDAPTVAVDTATALGIEWMPWWVGDVPGEMSDENDRIVAACMLAEEDARRVKRMPASLALTVEGWTCATDAVCGVRASATGPGPPRRCRGGVGMSDASEISEHASAMGPGCAWPRRCGGASGAARKGGRGLDVGETPRGDGPRGDGRLKARTSRGGGRRRRERGGGGWPVALLLAGACGQVTFVDEGQGAANTLVFPARLLSGRARWQRREQAWGFATCVRAQTTQP